MAEKTLSARRIGRALSSTRTRAILTIGCVLGLGTVGTLAYWTDSAAITGGTFTAGHLDLQVNDSNTPPPVTSLAMSNMAPGESVAATFTVQNKGTVDFTYTLGATASGTLAPHLRFATYTGGTATNGTSGGLRVGSCSGAVQTTNQTLSGGSTPVIPTAQTLVNTSGTQVVCVVATLDAATPNTVGGSTATATFTANAKQLGAP
jgi:predicted ribosomally synthesized peptide with SipW-like signal peptide